MKSLTVNGKLTVGVLALSVIFFGSYYEYMACFLSILMLGILAFIGWKRHQLSINKNYTAVFCFGIFTVSLLSVLWAVDCEMALVGTAKLLPVPLFLLILMQTEESDRHAAVAFIPHIAAVSTVLSAVGGLIPVLKDRFVVDGRISGTFEYPNTYAVYALMGLLIIIAEKRLSLLSGIEAAVLLGGIILSGSRTVYIVFAVTVLTAVVLSKNKKVTVAGLSVLGIFILSAALVYFAFPNAVLSRLFTVSAEDNTLLCRLLYWKDAIGQIIRHPLGLGYYGYYYTQGAFQTGVYYVINAHNEFLQMFLDYGWGVGIGFVWLFVYGIKNACSNTERLPLLALAFHCVMDFDMQYIGVFLTLVLLLPVGRGDGMILLRKRKSGVKKGRAGVLLGAIGGVAALYCLWLGVGNLQYYLGTTSVYPFYTPLQIKELTEAEDYETMNKRADSILSHNGNITVALDAKARLAFADGDVITMIKYKDRAIECSKYSIEEYEDYLYMLSSAIELYSESGEADSMNYCIEKALLVPDAIEKVKAETDVLGWKITPKPELTLGDEYSRYIDSLKSAIAD